MYLILSVVLWASFLALRSGYDRHLNEVEAFTQKNIDFWIAAICQGSSVLMITTPILRELILAIGLLLQLGRWWVLLSGPQARHRQIVREDRRRAKLRDREPDQVYPRLVAWRAGDILEDDRGLQYRLIRIRRDHKVEFERNLDSGSDRDRINSFLDRIAPSTSNSVVELDIVMKDWKNLSLLKREPVRDTDQAYWENLTLKQEAYHEVRRDSNEL